MLEIIDYLNSQLIFRIDSLNRDEVLKELIEKAAQLKKIQNPERFLEAVLKREEVVSTGIGLGVAIPHAKLSDYNDFFIIIGISKEGIDWHSLDGHPVRLVFLIGGPDDKQTEYLQILSALTLAIKDENRRRDLLRLEDPQKILALFKE